MAPLEVGPENGSVGLLLCPSIQYFGASLPLDVLLIFSALTGGILMVKFCLTPTFYWYTMSESIIRFTLEFAERTHASEGMVLMTPKHFIFCHPEDQLHIFNPMTSKALRTDTSSLYSCSDAFCNEHDNL